MKSQQSSAIHQRRWSRDHSGFTLLEVLVVVAVIALLTAIMLPSFTAAREQTRRAVCASNLRQIALAWNVYLNDSKGFFPYGANQNVNYGGLQGNGSQSYGKNPNKPVSKPLNRCLRLPTVLRTGGAVFKCPSDQGLTSVQPTAWQYYGTSYYPNDLLVGRQLWPVAGLPCSDIWARLVGDSSAWPPVPGMIARLKRDRIDNESLVMLSGDFPWYDNWDASVPDRFPYWHSRKGMHNIVFMDGHCEFLPIRKGIYVTSRWSNIPFKAFRFEFAQCQQEIICP